MSAVTATPADIDLEEYGITIQYGRDDVDYSSWYSDWMRRLARQHTIDDLARMLLGTRAESHQAAARHLRAVEASHSMSGQSMRRAHARNVVVASGDTAIALRGAIEIHALFPEHARPAGAGRAGVEDRNLGEGKADVARQHESAPTRARAGSAAGVSSDPVLLASVEAMA